MSKKIKNSRNFIKSKVIGTIPFSNPVHQYHIDTVLDNFLKNIDIIIVHFCYFFILTS